MPWKLDYKEELKLDMKEWKGPKLNANFEMAKYLSVVTYYGTISVNETLKNDKVTSKQCFIN